MWRFLKNLKTWGLVPEVVVTDGSNLDPEVLAELWPDARRQLCVFHVMKDLHKHVLDAVRRLRRGLSRRGHRGGLRGAGGARGGGGASGQRGGGVVLPVTTDFCGRGGEEGRAWAGADPGRGHSYASW